MQRPRFPLVVILALALLLAACAQTTSQSPAASDGGEPSAAGSEPAASEPGGGGNGAGGGLTLADGQWTAGSTHMVVSGDVSGTFDAELFPSSSYSTGGNTVLSYVDADSGATISVAIYPDYVAISIATQEFAGGAGSTQGQECEAAFHRGDDNRVEGTISCTHAPVIDSSGAAGMFMDIEGSFEATR